MYQHSFEICRGQGSEGIVGLFHNCTPLKKFYGVTVELSKKQTNINALKIFILYLITLQKCVLL